MANNDNNSNRRPLKNRPREEHDYQLFLQADLECVEIDWNDHKDEEKQNGESTPIENKHAEECNKLGASAIEDGECSSKLKRRRKSRKVSLNHFNTNTSNTL